MTHFNSGALPLMTHLDEDGYYAPMEDWEKPSGCNSGNCGCAEETVARIRRQGFDREAIIPDSPPAPGEQYRFHFDATRCIGCKCCVVACNEQNGNPASVNWRRVGEIEGGRYPTVQRLYLSMGCNHCLDPSCLAGCPTGAYTKDPATGIVRHEADSCIGCQYCTWNCPYGVPQFNPERSIVTKCDMCYSRLKEGQQPACVAACPEQAIRIEKVNVDEWRARHETADAPGMPESDLTISTTRITLPEGLAENVRTANAHRVEPEHPHTPLIFLLTLTQLSVGGFFALWLVDLATFLGIFSPAPQPHVAAMSAGLFLVAALALNASIFHLGRPIHAWKAIRMWRRSWLSREVLLFGIFSGLAALQAALTLAPLLYPPLASFSTTRVVLGSAVVTFGLAGIYSSARIYMVPARPSWNSQHTLLRFFSTAFLLGPLFVAAIALACEVLAPSGDTQIRILSCALLGVASGGAIAQSISLQGSLRKLSSSRTPELLGTATLLTRRFRPFFLARLTALTSGGLVGPTLLILWSDYHAAIIRLAIGTVTSFFIALLGEGIGRYLFFVTVVPKNMAGAFFRS